jgi:EAL domain-containing protein (putative c-di-GMP-specific phosphodiesterase class I)/DNA-binding NarL/FixJ family response regulator
LSVRVLIAEDETTVRRALCDLIQTEDGLELAGSAADADEAIELIERWRPDVALVDVKMPGGGGPRVARAIARLSPGTRIVALSAYEDRSSVFQMLRAGAVSYLVKGAPLVEIIETIRKAALGQAVLSAEVTSEVVHALAGQLELEEGTKEKRRGQVERIRGALQPGVLRSVFQPIVDLETGRAIGYEALSRFDAFPARSPDLWFGEAMNVGLQAELELAAVQMALSHLPDIDDDLFISVNLSPEALLSPSVLAELEANPKRTVVEVTEHAQIEDYAVLNHALLELRSAGLRLAIDDAGAGYSSLRHVIETSPDMVKIDGSLTQRIELERGRRALASALISFAREMNQVVVAEGIETPSAVAALLSLGVNCGQGFHIGRPRPLEAALDDAAEASSG